QPQSTNSRFAPDAPPLPAKRAPDWPRVRAAIRGLYKYYTETRALGRWRKWFLDTHPPTAPRRSPWDRIAAASPAPSGFETRWRPAAFPPACRFPFLPETPG